MTHSLSSSPSELLIVALLSLPRCCFRDQLVICSLRHIRLHLARCVRRHACMKLYHGEASWYIFNHRRRPLGVGLRQAASYSTKGRQWRPVYKRNNQILTRFLDFSYMLWLFVTRASLFPPFVSLQNQVTCDRSERTCRSWLVLPKMQATDGNVQQ